MGVPLLILSVVSAGCLASCGGGGDGVSRPTEPPPASAIELTISADVELGTGLLSPYKLLRLPGFEDRLLVVTGRGETYPEGRLHLVDADTFSDLAEPMDVGLNGADAVVTGDRVVVISRGAGRASLVDVGKWRMLSEFELGFPAGAIDVLPGGEVVVVSAVDGVLVLLGIEGDRLVERRRRMLGTFAYDVVCDPDSGLVYVVQPLAGVEIIDPRDLSRRNLVSLPGEPGRGAAIWRGFLVVSNRDGYLHFIDRASRAVKTLDLAVELGLDRGQLPVRGIDPGEIQALDDDRLLVVNGRQSSLIFDRAVDPEIPVRALASLPGGQSAAYLGESNRIVVAQPSENRFAIALLPTSPLRGSILSSRLSVTGREIVGWAPMETEDRAVALQDSSGAIHVVDDRGNLVRSLAAQSGQTWRRPFTPVEGGFVVNAVDRDAGPSLVVIDRAGVLQRTTPLTASSIFSLASHGTTVAAVSRLSRQLQFVDWQTGDTRTVALARDRPRLALPLGEAWIVAHDTHPDIGISLLRGDAVERFQAFDDWFSGLVRTGSARALTASFYGSVAIVDEQGRISDVRRLGIPNVSDARSGNGQTVWLTSESLGFSHRIRNDGSSIDGRYSLAGVRSVLAFPGSETLAVITARHVAVARE